MIWQILTAALVILKLLDLIAISWWLVFLPTIASAVVFIVFSVLALWAFSK